MSKLEKFLRGRFAAAVVAVLVGFAISAIVLAAAGYNPIGSFAALFNGAFGRPKYIANVIIKATPILLTGVSVAFAFKTGLFNIGAEGQYILGTTLATIVGVKLNLPMPLQVPIVLASGIIGGAALGAFVGWLKAHFGIHEVITSIMCNWIAFYLCNFVVMSDAFHKPNSTSALQVNGSSYTMILGNWKKSPDGKAFLKGIPWLREIVAKTDLNYGFIIAVIVAILISVVLTRTKLGYELRAVGFNRDAARFSGISVERNIVLSMLIAGAISGPYTEPCGWEGNYVRVSLGAIKEGLISADGLTDALVKSAIPVTDDAIVDWKKEWRAILSEIKSAHPGLPGLAEDSMKLDSLLASGQFACHHSKEYSRAYHPHYRIVRREFINDLMKHY